MADLTLTLTNLLTPPAWSLYPPSLADENKEKAHFGEGTEKPFIESYY